MIDTHCHIDEEAFDNDRELVIARQKEAGVTALIVPGVNTHSIQTVMEVCHQHPHFCYPALGLHPEDVKADWQNQLGVVEQAIRAYRPELVAIGEIGLDYHWDKTYVAEQHEVLRHQLRIAGELHLPVILHNREATEDILRIVRQEKEHSPITGVFHCFNGSKETAMQILDMGFYLGIGGVITFKNCKLAEMLADLQSSYPSLLDRLLLETDAPYMAPVPHRGERNESRFICHVVDRLAEALNCSKEELLKKTMANSGLLFGLK